MPYIRYLDKNFSMDRLNLIDKINEVIYIYQVQGYTLTLRQLYYQLVARGIIENNMRSYKNTGALINDARLAGLIDWEAIGDRTRKLKTLSRWKSPVDIIDSAIYSYSRDLWEHQNYYLEVWVEKEALVEVVATACKPWDVSYFCCRGYVSQSEMWEAAQRLVGKCNQGKDCLIIHLGDHDPSGIDMSRDIEERLQMFGNHDSDNFASHFQGLRRIALNMGQIKQFNPPPNPAKTTDSRYKSKFGDDSWELDALEPKVITSLIQDTISEYANEDIMDAVKYTVKREKNVMRQICNNWDAIMRRYGD